MGPRQVNLGSGWISCDTSAGAAGKILWKTPTGFTHKIAARVTGLTRGRSYTQLRSRIELPSDRQPTATGDWELSSLELCREKRGDFLFPGGGVGACPHGLGQACLDPLRKERGLPGVEGRSPRAPLLCKV